MNYETTCQAATSRESKCSSRFRKNRSSALVLVLLCKCLLVHLRVQDAFLRSEYGTHLLHVVMMSEAQHYSVFVAFFVVDAGNVNANIITEPKNQHEEVTPLTFLYMMRMPFQITNRVNFVN